MSKPADLPADLPADFVGTVVCVQGTDYGAKLHVLSCKAKVNRAANRDVVVAVLWDRECRVALLFGEKADYTWLGKTAKLRQRTDGTWVVQDVR